jgi:hypothetical protein
VLKEKNMEEAFSLMFVMSIELALKKSNGHSFCNNVIW